MNSGVLMELLQFQQKCSLQEPKEASTKLEKLPTLVHATHHKPLVHKSSSVYHRHPEWDPPKFVFKARPVPRHSFTWKQRSPRQKTLHVTEVKPFSFHERDKDIERKKSERLRKILEEEKKLREYHARPVPSWIFRYRLSSPEMRTLQSHRKKPRNPRSTQTATKETAEKLFEEKILQKKALTEKLSEESNKQDRKVMLMRSKAEHNMSPIKLENRDQKQSSTVPTCPAPSIPSAPGLNNGTLKLKSSSINPVKQRTDVNKPKVNTQNQQNFELKKKPTKVKVFEQKKIPSCAPKPPKIDPVKSKSVRPVNKVQQIVKAKEVLREKNLPAKHVSCEILEDLMKPSRERSVSLDDVVLLKTEIPAAPKNSLENLKTVVLDDDHKIEVKAEVKRIDYNHLYESIVEIQQKLTTRRNADDNVKPRAKTILKPVTNFNLKSPETEAKVVPLKRKGSLLSDSNDSV